MKKTATLLPIILFIVLRSAFASTKGMNSEPVTFKKLGAGRAFGIINNTGFSLLQFHSVIDLHRGYAVVRDEYLFRRNDKNRNYIRFQIPSEGTFRANGIDTVQYRNWSAVQISLNSHKIPNDSVIMRLNRGQYEWDASINRDTTDLVVHYIVNTHDAVLRKHFDVEHSYGFCYVLDPLKSWKGSISNISFFIHLPYLLNGKWIDGILPKGSFKISGQDLMLAKRDVPVTDLKNIIVRYGKTSIYTKEDNFYFPSVLVSKNKWFDQTDLLAAQIKDTTGYKVFEKYEFTPAPLAFFSISGVVIVFVLLGIGIFILVVWAIIAQYKNMK